MVAALASCFGILVTIVGVAYVSGRLTQQIAENRKLVDEHDRTLAEHGERLSDHDVKIGRLHEWKSGFNAGAAVTIRPENNG